MDSLDLYAKIEPLIGFYDEYERLYSSYLKKIKSLHVKSILDIGCGNGRFLKHLKDASFNHLGIDRSKEMVKRACELEVNAKVIELSELKENTFECVTAIGDVVNYIKDEELEEFFCGVKRVLTKEGYFLFDINTEVGFELTDGVMVKDFEDKFLSIEADFNGQTLQTSITFFEKQDKFFKRYKANITQYFHHLERFKHIEGFEVVSTSFLGMFESEDEKMLIVLKSI